MGSSMSKRHELEKDIVLKVKERFGENLSAVALFGSLARGETGEYSDIDLLVVLRKLPPSLVERRRLVYRALAPIREKYHRDTTTIEMEEGDVGQVTPLILNVASDGIVLYDKEGNLTEFLDKVRKSVEEVGLIRYRTRDGKYGWKLKETLKPGERFKIEV